ncbi:phage tail tape-measure protein [Ensifer sp. ENS12]|uniref:phage tail tape-measure protein n=1 Tax=Ensifer sp. ENS12 TaxID=2854774 RepID=UPI000DE59308|nr:phage tail tape-measure protein [Ensifer sp. ENS12]MBV7522304.1 phage tail tape-measure protein [Ensifer sp. ENS12]
MADVATLGIQVKTDGTERATAELTKVSGAAARAQAEVEGLNVTNRGVTGAASVAAKAYANEGAAAAAASKQVQMLNLAANQNSSGLVKMNNTANLAAQGFDIVTTAAGGMNAGLIGMQQGLQVAQVAMMSSDSFAKTLAASFAAMLSPVTFLAVALTTLAAVGIQTVNWSKLAASALELLASVLEDIAPYAVAAAAALALLYAPAIVGGVVSLIALLGRFVVQLGIVAGSLLLANPAVAFIAGITAAVAAAVVFRDELAEIFGRDIVADAKNGINFIVGAFVGGFNAVKAAWDKLPAALGDVVYSTAQGVIKAVQAMVQTTVGGINNLINKYALWSASIGRPLQNYNDMIIEPIEFGNITNPYKGAAGGALQTAIDEMKAAQGTDYVGGVVDAIGRGASAASDKLRELAKGLTDVDEKSKKRAGKSEQEKYADIVAGAERQIAMLEAERDAMGLTERAAAALRYEQQFLNEAQQRGISLTDAQRSELAGLAETMATIEEETRLLGQALDFGKALTRGFFDDFFAGIERGKSIWRSFGDAALGVLDRIADKLLTDVIDAVFTVSNAGKGGGGLLGILGGIFGGSSAADPWAGLRGYATGTPSARPGVAWVGEKGPELVRFKGGEEVIPNHRLYRPANTNAPAQSSSSAQAQPMQVVLRVIGEEGPMFRPTIRSESENVTIENIRAYDQGKRNEYDNGGEVY